TGNRAAEGSRREGYRRIQFHVGDPRLALQQLKQSVGVDGSRNIDQKKLAQCAIQPSCNGTAKSNTDLLYPQQTAIQAYDELVVGSDLSSEEQEQKQNSEDQKTTLHFASTRHPPRFCTQYTWQAAEKPSRNDECAAL